MNTSRSHIEAISHPGPRRQKHPASWILAVLVACILAPMSLKAGDLITSGPLRVSSPDVLNSAPRIVTSSWGDLFAVWESSGNDQTRIVFATGALSGWQAPEIISREGAMISRHPVLALDPSGAVHAAWCEDNGTTSGVVLRTLTGGAWGEARLVRERRLYHCEYPDIAAGLDNGEGLALVWQERFGSLSTVMGLSLLPGLGEARLIALPAGDSPPDLQLFPRLLPHPREGTAYWYSIEEQTMRLHAAELDLTRGEWYDVEAALAPCAPLERLPMLFPPPTEALGALWLEEATDQQDQIRLEVRDTCEGLAITSAEGELLQDSYPAIAITAPDLVTLAWRVTTTDGSLIKIAQLNIHTLAWRGAAFAPSAPGQTLGSTQPAVAVDGFGLMHVLWVGDPAAGGDGGLFYSYGFWSDDF